MLFSSAYQCIFCLQRCGSRFAWERHEETLHHPREAWICCKGQHAPSFQETIMEYQGPNMGRCPLCTSKVDAHLLEHLAKSHRFQQCMERPVSDRTFFRKDQLSQRLQTYHKCRIVDKSFLLKCHTKLN